MKETPILKRIMLSCSTGTTRLFRNNVGQYEDKAGNWIRYGMYNPGGSDLIGWTQLTIRPEHVGRTVAVFTAIEVKGTQKRKNGLTKDQAVFGQMVTDAGGLFGMARSVEEAKNILRRQSYREMEEKT